MFSRGNIEKNSKGNSILTSFEKSFAFKALWDYFSLTRLIQNNVSILRPLTLITSAKFLLPYDITYSQVPGIRAWAFLGKPFCVLQERWKFSCKGDACHFKSHLLRKDNGPNNSLKRGWLPGPCPDSKEFYNWKQMWCWAESAMEHHQPWPSSGAEREAGSHSSFPASHLFQQQKCAALACYSPSLIAICLLMCNLLMNKHEQKLKTPFLFKTQALYLNSLLWYAYVLLHHACTSEFALQSL